MIGRFVHRCWITIEWLAVLIAVAALVAVVAWYVYQSRINEEVRRQVETRFAQNYPGLQVRVRGAELVHGEGIHVRGLTVVEPAAAGPRSELLTIDEIVVECNTDLRKLLAGQVETRRIRVGRPVLRMTRRPDLTWSSARLLPLPQFGNRPVEVLVDRGTVEIFDPLKSPAGSATLRDLCLAISPHEGASGPASLRGFRGSCSSDHFRQVNLEGWFDSQSGACQISGAVEGQEISPELRGSLPSDVASRLTVLGSLRGQASARFRVSYDPAAPRPFDFEVSGQILQGRIDEPWLPHALSDMRAKFRCVPEGVSLDYLTARSGPATLSLSGRCAGYDAKSPFALQAEIRNLDLNPQVLAILPPKLQEQWQRYRPSGQIDADVKLARTAAGFQPEVTIRCTDVSFTYSKFDYRLNEGRGSVVLKNDALSIHLTAAAGGDPVRIDAEYANLSADPVGWLEARADKIEIDHHLLEALPPEAESVVRSLGPSGASSVFFQIRRDRPGEPMRKWLRLGLAGCSIQYIKFPYPLSNVYGTVEMVDDHWTFRNLVGTNDSGSVICAGWFAGAAGRKELCLTFTGTGIGLESELRDALQPTMRDLWGELRPRGEVDLTAEVRYLPENRKLDVAVRARPKSEVTSIEPVRFPYRLERLEGDLAYRDGQLTLDGMKAEHGTVRMAADGACHFRSDGSWGIRLDHLDVDQLHLNRELFQAVPERLRKLLETCKPQGPVNLSGAFELGRTAPGEPVRAGWDVKLVLQQASLDCGVPLRNINGELTLVGASDGHRLGTRGEFDLDSLHYRDVQLTNITGPLWFDDQRILLGGWVDHPKNGAPAPADGSSRRPMRSLQARTLGGQVEGDGLIQFGQEVSYRFHAKLSNADLAECARDLTGGRQDMTGRVHAEASLWSTGLGLHNLEGKGSIRLTDANIYRLPLMIQLLKILAVREPDSTAFSQAEMEYAIKGNHIYLSRLNFRGDAISLEGAGEMDFAGNLDLSFHSRLGKNDRQLPVVRQVLGGAADQILVLRVTGNIEEPIVGREALPGVKRALEELQTDLQNPAAVEPAGAESPPEGIGEKLWSRLFQ